jgi:probable rRNA maturation factor
MTAITEAETPPAAASDPPALIIDLQDARPQRKDRGEVPGIADLERWANAAFEAGLQAQGRSATRPTELTLRIVDEDEGAELNRRYRGRTGPTNVLSFIFEPPPGLDPEDPLAEPFAALLGDLVICAPVVRREAGEQCKAETAHWAHLVAHGVLHLLGFDHLTAAEATAMEALEIRILGTLGFPSPYEVIDDVHDERRRI